MKSTVEIMFEARAEVLRMEAELNLLKAKENKNITWKGLTMADKEEYLSQDLGGSRLDAMDWAEARLKSKNQG